MLRHLLVTQDTTPNSIVNKIICSLNKHLIILHDGKKNAMTMTQEHVEVRACSKQQPTYQTSFIFLRLPLEGYANAEG